MKEDEKNHYGATHAIVDLPEIIEPMRKPTIQLEQTDYDQRPM